MKNTESSNFYCTKCGGQGIPILRKNGKYKEPGHLKKLYCINCQEQRNMVEIRPAGKYDYFTFKLEFDYGNFTEDGGRNLPWKQFVAQLRDKGVI